MSKVIPKEQLTAYQRWELAAFEESETPPRTGAAGSPAGHVQDGFDEDTDLRLNLPTAEDLEHIQQAAWQEGYNLGLEEGRKAGFETGRQEGEKYARQLRLLTESLESERLRQDGEVAQEILTLALVVARQVVGTSLRVKPELLLDTMRQALLSLPSLSGHYRVFVHPDSAQVVRDWLAQEHNHLSWKLVEDEQMEPGGFRFESAHSELDGSMQVRWREISECLGASTEWLD
ncbi:MAG: flagellar assembly protein FliH [Thiobacillus sp.]|nr:flagellar assembly protein FliH [Thiobacillus sp.]